MPKTIEVSAVPEKLIDPKEGVLEYVCGHLYKKVLNGVSIKNQVGSIGGHETVDEDSIEATLCVACGEAYSTNEYYGHLKIVDKFTPDFGEGPLFKDVMKARNKGWFKKKPPKREGPLFKDVVKK